jgi:predicted Zn-ribbon and HTH transcriptional regulator
MPAKKPSHIKRRKHAGDEDDGERLSCEECGESFNVNESGSENRCPRCA